MADVVHCSPFSFSFLFSPVLGCWFCLLYHVRGTIPVVLSPGDFAAIVHVYYGIPSIKYATVLLRPFTRQPATTAGQGS